MICPNYGVYYGTLRENIFRQYTTDNIYYHHSRLRPNQSPRLIDVQIKAMNIVHGAMTAHEFTKNRASGILENLDFFENSLRNDCETF